MLLSGVALLYWGPGFSFGLELEQEGLGPGKKKHLGFEQEHVQAERIRLFQQGGL